MADRVLWWVGSSLDDVRTFPDDAKRQVGFQLRRVQHGLEPNDWKPMPTIGPGVQEIRIHTTKEHRVIYIAKFTQGVFVLHAFEKRGRKTAKRDIDLARERLRAVRQTLR